MHSLNVGTLWSLIICTDIFLLFLKVCTLYIHFNHIHSQNLPLTPPTYTTLSPPPNFISLLNSVAHQLQLMLFVFFWVQGQAHTQKKKKPQLTPPQKPSNIHSSLELGAHEPFPLHSRTFTSLLMCGCCTGTRRGCERMGVMVLP